MATYTKIPLSQSSNGSSILVSTSATPGVLIHTTQALSANSDEIWLYAFNNTQFPANLTIYWGNTATNNNCTNVINPNAGMAILTPGLLLKGDGSSGAVIYSTCATPSAVNIVGYVNRITA